MSMATIRAKRGREGKQALFGALRLAALALASTARADGACANPDALGTSRVLALGTEGLEAGLKTYPRSLPLADHELVLTFDDGPAPATTPKIMAALRHEC